jgi:pyruvate dehydrogenase E2 component (dihydrolipoamide acetyltransferase)
VATEVELPQLGESVTEGIITAWLVEVGDEVEVDQPLAEISTDKVDTEIPSPVAGTVTELKAEVDDEVEVGQVIAVVGEPDEAGAGDDDADEAGDDETDEETDETPADDGGDDGEEPDEGGEAAEATSDEPAEDEATAADDDGRSGKPAKAPSATDGGDGASAGSKALTSPLVRKLLREADLGPDDVRGTGPGGRITREDAERAIDAGGEGEGGSQPQQAAGSGQQPSPGGVVPAPVVPTAPSRERPAPSPTQIDFGDEREVTQDLSRIRRAIAKSMLESLQTTAQLTAAVEVDLTPIMNLRAAVKDEFKEREGASLSPLPLISRAVCMTLPRHPSMNASIDQEADTATYHRYINLGMAVDTERGLLVPNIKDAQDLTVPGLARAIADLASRTRNKKLQPDEISGGTFTITNTGSMGTLFDTPILNPPEVAILATAAVEKRPVVVSDAYGDSIAIRWMSYLCLTYDHRMVDGADAARFLQDLKYVLETHDFSAELGL